MKHPTAEEYQILSSSTYDLGETLVTCQLFQSNGGSNTPLTFGVHLSDAQSQSESLAHLSLSQAQKLYHLLTTYHVSPSHFWDIIEDLVYEDIQKAKHSPLH